MINNLIKLGGYFLLAREAVDFVSHSRYDRERELRKRNTACTISGSLIGMTMGVAVGILFAPKSGKETRELISSTTSEKMKELQQELEERKKYFNEMISRKKEELCSKSEELVEEVTE